MRRLGGAVIRMQLSLIDNLSFCVGDRDLLINVRSVPVREPFSDRIAEFLNAVSRRLLSDSKAKAYPDVVTLAFWMRKASIDNLRTRYDKGNMGYRLGRGVAFHVAPSNVPVNYAYSLVTGLLCGNVNLVRIPSKEFEQVAIINRTINEVLNEEFADIKPYVVLVKYGHEQNINDVLSELADVRIIWGGDATIDVFRESKLHSRAVEITFADRYSLAVINADEYLKVDNKVKVARNFYNDTYLTDQNACTSPRMVVWMGNNISEAKKLFWSELHKIVSENGYKLQDVKAVSKLASVFLLAGVKANVKKEPMPDNLIVRVKISELTTELMQMKNDSGYFLEYDCKDIMELQDICNNTRCQTIAYIGNKAIFSPLVKSGIRGIDRIVPIGKTMDFDMVWDGNNLYEFLTRIVVIE